MAVGWQVVSDSRRETGFGSLYYGDPATATYYTGKDEQGIATLPNVVVPDSDDPVLTVSFYPDLGGPFILPPKSTSWSSS